MMLLLLRPDANYINGKPVEHVQERLSNLVSELEKNKTKIIIPTPVFSEMLIKADDARLALIEHYQKSSVFKVASFDTLAAIELAEINRQAAAGGNKKGNSTESWAKIKFDRQIVAIAKVHSATAIYSDDKNLATFAEKAGIKVIKLIDIPVPASAAQGKLFAHLPQEVAPSDANINDLAFQNVRRKDK